MEYNEFYCHLKQIKIGPFLVHSTTFKGLEVTGANQELSLNICVTQDLAMRQIS